MEDRIDPRRLEVGARLCSGVFGAVHAGRMQEQQSGKWIEVNTGSRYVAPVNNCPCSPLLLVDAGIHSQASMLACLKVAIKMMQPRAHVEPREYTQFAKVSVHSTHHD